MTEEANTNEELFIEIEEVEKVYTAGQAERLSVSQLMAHDSYLPINLKECWEDTATERVFFRKESIKDIAEMLRNFNAYSGDRADMEQESRTGVNVSPQERGRDTTKANLKKKRSRGNSS